MEFNSAFKALNKQKVQNFEIMAATTILYGCYDYSGDQIQKNELVGACGTHRGKNRCMQSFGGKPEKNIPHGRPRCIWEDNNGMDIKRPVGRMWTGMFWFLKRTSDGLL